MSATDVHEGQGRMTLVRPQRSPPTPPLRCNDLLFINEYLANGRNATQAYRVVHPKSSYKCANVEAVRVLAKPSVQQEIAQRIQHEAGITKQGIEADLLLAKSWAIERKNPLELASVSMDCAKLAGFLVEKRQDVTPPPTLNPQQTLEELRRRGIAALTGQADDPQDVGRQKGV